MWDRWSDVRSFGALTIPDIRLTMADMRGPSANAVVLSGFAELVQSAGSDPMALLRRARIPRAVLTDPEARIPVDRLALLLDAAAEATGWPDFALRLTKARRLSHFGHAGLLARDEADVRQALLAVISNIHLHSEDLVFQLVDGDSEVAVTARLAVLPSSSSPQIDDLLLGGLFQLMKHLMDKHWHPVRVTFTHSLQGRTRLYRQYFDCPVLLGMEANAIVSATSELERVLPEADPMFLKETQRQLDERAASRHLPLDARVADLVKVLLPTGRCNMERVALRLGLQTRTLHRHLKDKGTTFSQLVDETRRDLARRYVAWSDRPMLEIAVALGFSETSAFSRWFSQAFKQTPTAMRSAHMRKE